MMTQDLTAVVIVGSREGEVQHAEVREGEGRERPHLVAKVVFGFVVENQ
jgi:hypothetical protein